MSRGEGRAARNCTGMYRPVAGLQLSMGCSWAGPRRTSALRHRSPSRRCLSGAGYIRAAARRGRHPVDRRGITPPERHALPDLVRDLETLTRPAVQALTRASLTHPPPHRALGDLQATNRQLDLLRAQPTLVRKRNQAAHNRRARQARPRARNLPTRRGPLTVR